MTDIGEFVRLPLFGPIGLVFSFLLMAVLIAAMIGALWVVRIPGPVAHSETRRGRRLGGFLMLMQAGGVILVVLGIGYSHLPVAAPKAVMLSTRSRGLETGVDPARSVWVQRWEQLAENARRSRCLDAGPLVDSACATLAASPPAEGWDPTSAAVRDHIRSVALPIITSRARAQPVLKTAGEYLDVGTPSVLPAWVVESIELASIKALNLSHNTREVRVLAKARETRVGNAWGETTKAYLRSDPTRSEQLLVEVDEVGDRAPVLLSDFYRCSAKDDSIRAVVLVEVDNKRLLALADSEIKELARVQLYSNPESPHDSVIAERLLTIESESDGPRFLQQMFDRVAIREVAGIRQPATGVSVSVPKIAAPDGTQATAERVGGSSRVAVLVEPARVSDWQHTVQALRADGFTNWREDMKNGKLTGGVEPEEMFAVRTSSGDAEVVAWMTDRGVWVGPADTLTDMPQLPQKAESSSSVFRARSLAQDAPGLYSLAGVQLPGAERYSLTEGDSLGRVTSVTRTLVSSVRFGTDSASGSPDLPLVTRVLIPRDEGGHAVATYIGVDPSSIGVVFTGPEEPPQGYDSARFLSFWTEVLRAAYDSSYSIGSGQEISTRNESSEPPFVLIDSRTMNEIRARSARAPLLTGASGLLLFSISSMVSSYLSRRRG